MVHPENEPRRQTSWFTGNEPRSQTSVHHMIKRTPRAASAAAGRFSVKAFIIIIIETARKTPADHSRPRDTSAS